MRPRPSARRLAAPALLAVLGLAPTGPADTVVLTSARDNTLIEVAGGTKSNALGDVFAGRVGAFGGGTRRRGVMFFDIAGSVPAGSTITGVTLTLTVISAPFGNPPQTVSLHRALANWGEGTSFFPGGQGAPATLGDATWLHTFFNTQTWASAGGDFAATPSASISVGVIGPFTWGPAAQMTADVQNWLDNPSGNFGWLIRGNEAVQQTARRFGSHEAQPAQQPVLTVQFDSAPACPWDCGDDNGEVGINDFLAILATWGLPGPCDFDGDGEIGIVDFLDLLAHWGPCP